MRRMMALGTIMTLVLGAAGNDGAGEARRKEYIDAAVNGVGFLPWQEHGVSEAEMGFRMALEARKDETLANAIPIEHPCLLRREDLDRARRRVAEADWAQAWFAAHKARADAVIEQPDGYVEAMIEELTPWFGYGFTCPNCVGRLSQEGTGNSLYEWRPDKPDVIRCRPCGQTYPDAAFPETATLECPRSEQVFTFYLNDAERANPEDRSGALAYHWVGHPMHMSFSGLIRQEKVQYMIGALESLAYTYAFTGEPAYAEKAVAVLERLAHCYPNWLYHDYWGAVADCDPMYAAWHAGELPLVWKRHLCADAFARDTLDKAAMLQSYWGAGRYHPSTDSVSAVTTVCQAYDLVYNAADRNGDPLWTPKRRRAVEGDLILEWIIGAEPYLGGRNHADRHDNKTPRIYYAQAVAARCLGIAEVADTALRGYEAVRDHSFAYDGMSHESPAYTNMYLGPLLWIPETLTGFPWPDAFPARQAVADLYAGDARLRLMYRAVIDQLQPDGCYLPIEDTSISGRPSQHILELGFRHYPEYFAGVLRTVYPDYQPGEYALFHLDDNALDAQPDVRLPEVFYPAWKTALLRHGAGPGAAVLALNDSPSGGHRHYDNLAMLYIDRGRTILGDLGYVGDMPVNTWVKSTFSHNLVVVDDAQQEFKGRAPRFELMATTPTVSVVELSSNAYPQCREYRRLMALVKGPDNATFVVDVFRVKGGAKHAYRISSELASSDAADGGLRFDGIPMPEQPLLVSVGASLRTEDIYGLRDTVSAAASGPWQARWHEPGRAYRLWMCSTVDRVEASNGPGQRGRHDPGRRLRYVDAVREGKDLESVFVAVHEPGAPDGVLAIQSVERIELPAEAGADAVALRIASAWGTYWLLGDCAGEMAVDGIRFQGKFGAFCEPAAGKPWLVGVGAATLQRDALGFAGTTPAWTGHVTVHTDNALTTDAARPADWPAPADGYTAYAAVDDTGFAVAATEANRIALTRFPVSAAETFRLPALRYSSTP